MKFTQVIITIVCMVIGFALPLQASELIETHSAEPDLISQVTTWQPYGSEAAQFSAQFPSEPETRTRTVPIAEQPTDWTIFRVQDDTGFYAVAYTNLTPEAIELGADAVIDSIKNTLTEEFNWSALNGRGRPIEVDGYPTHEIIRDELREDGKLEERRDDARRWAENNEE